MDKGIRSKLGLLTFLVGLAAILLTAGCSSDKTTDSDAVLFSATSDNGLLKVVVTENPGSPCPLTTITYDVPIPGNVFLEVTNATGYSVKVLVDGPSEPGTFEVTWDGTNDDGEGIGDGIYLLHLGGPDGGTYLPMVLYANAIS